MVNGNASLSGSTGGTFAPPPIPATHPLTNPPVQFMVVPHMGSSQTNLVTLVDPGLGASASSPMRSSVASTSTRPPSDPTVWGFALVDPYHPSLQRVPVPPSVVSKTAGITHYNNDVASSSTKPCGSSICVKFTTRDEPLSCPAGELCTHFHVERSYLESARRQTESLCCAIHNDYFTREMLASNCAPHLTSARFTLVLEDRAEVELLPNQLAFTVGLDHLSLRGTTRIINFRKHVCRLHLEGKCKWTKDCGHVHVCREFHRFLTSFHFPSLVFLLMTETDCDAIVGKLKESSQLLAFIKSKCSIPLVASLIEGKKMSALEALMKSGGCFTSPHAEAIVALGVTRALPPSQIIPNDVELVPKQPPVPKFEAAPTSPKDLTMPTFSPSASVTSAPVVPEEKQT